MNCKDVGGPARVGGGEVDEAQKTDTAILRESSWVISTGTWSRDCARPRPKCTESLNDMEHEIEHCWANMQARVDATMAPSRTEMATLEDRVTDRVMMKFNDGNKKKMNDEDTRTINSYQSLHTCVRKRHMVASGRRAHWTLSGRRCEVCPDFVGEPVTQAEPVTRGSLWTLALVRYRCQSGTWEGLRRFGR